MTVPSVCLVVLDGWGLAPDGPGNAVALADTPVFDRLWAERPHTTLTAKGEAVGLPAGQMGNSEVGHLNLGAGAIVPQDLARIDAAVADGALAQNATLRAALSGAERVHLIGLVSGGGVHSSEEHLAALLRLAASWNVPDVVIHAFTDGRDTSPTSGAASVAGVEALGIGRLGSVVGRYYAMDRDQRWDRTGLALDLLVEGRAPHHASTGEQAVRDAYERGETDEFITATAVGEEARIRSGDAVLAFNFRPDRMRQIVSKLSEVTDRITTLTEYDEDWTFAVVFPPARPALTLAQVISDAGRAQLHVAETEKYPHVTYFFNGGEEHLAALLRLAASWNVPDVVIHEFTDGRDTSPTSGAASVAGVEALGIGRVGSVVGRYYAMDRDQRWDRTGQAVDLLVEGRAPHHASTGEQAVRDAYERGETDEFITATTVGDEARIRSGDAILAFNFRPDRMRQIVSKLSEVTDRITTLTEYDEDWTFPVVFPPARPALTLAQVISDAGRAQLHVAETEKYPHVTYFFNGGEEHPFAGEVRELAPSPRDVPTYDHKPEMSAREATDAFLRHWAEQDFAFAIINFANADMVGHTGVIPAAVRAVETVDECLGRVVEAVHATGGACIVTADHGNADHMLEDDGSVNTAHSLNPVPLVVTAGAESLDGEGILADVAPTALALLGMPQPEQMTGRSLIG